MEEPLRGDQLLAVVVDLIRDRLPAGWGLERGNSPARERDAAMRLFAPDGRSVQVSVEAKVGSPSGRSATDVGRRLLDEAALSHSVPLLIARYLAPPVREDLQRMGVSYADATGNVMVSAVDPGLYVSDRGADRDPWRGVGRPRGTLKGEPAARVVRALLDFSGPWKARELVAISHASTGATYRVLEYLDREGLVERDLEKKWSVPSWERLLRAWARDYHFAVDNVVSTYIDPRGTEHFIQSVVGKDVKYAITGAIAAHQWTRVAPARSIFVYVHDAADAARSWQVRATESGANVVFIEPRTEASFVFDRLQTLPDGARRVSAAQAAVDLLNGPGRDPQEAEELIRWMGTNEDEWRLR